MPQHEPKFIVSKPKFPANTLFLVPDIPYDRTVIELYLRDKYEGVDGAHIQNAFNMDAVPFVQNMQIVVMAIRPPEHTVRLQWTIGTDAHGVKYEIPVPPAEHVQWVVESPVLRVSDLVQMQPSQIFRPTKPDLSKLIATLVEHAHPYRIQPQNPPDAMCRMMFNA